MTRLHFDTTLRSLVLRSLAKAPATAKDLHRTLMKSPECADATIAGVYKALTFWADQGAISVCEADVQVARNNLARMADGKEPASTRAAIYQITSSGSLLVELAQQKDNTLKALHASNTDSTERAIERLYRTMIKGVLGRCAEAGHRAGEHLAAQR